MKESNIQKVYSRWRRAEAYMVPMTEEGQIRAEERYTGFKLGYEMAIKDAICRLEREHSQVKSQHSFFYRATEFLKEMIN